MAGRRERPLEPGTEPVHAFARELRALRSATGGVTYREMARRAHYSVSTLSQAAAGQQLPSLPVALAYAAACGGDREEWEARWRRAADELARRTARALAEEDGSDPPYRGLARYETGDRALFFGRDHLVDRLAATLAAHRFVMVTGASGSGKSSLLRAGLIPRLQHPGDGTGPGPDGDGSGRPCAAVRVLTPGPRPASTHAGALTPATGTDGTADPDGDPRRPGDTVVIVDQFEEVFTLCRDPEERARFLELLLAARDPDGGLRIVVAVRADFYGHVSEHPALVDVLREAHLPIGPMTPAELRQTVVGPARTARLVVERELTARIVEDGAGQPGSLPLMSHALLETWRRRQGRTLTLAAYEAIGGVHGAVADTAEETYVRLTPPQAAHARRILLRLITPGQGAQDTRRPAPRAELEAGHPREAAVVLEHLARARLITLDGGVADLAHEALITAWPRLRNWIAEDREGLAVHRELTEAAAAWHGLARDQGALYRGVRLAVAREWLGRDDRAATLTPLEREFLETSAATEDSERARVLRRNRQLRWLSAGLALLLVVLTGVSVVALRQRQRAVEAQWTALSRQLASQALRLAGVRPGTAMLLSLEAYRAARTPEARGTLLSMSTRRVYQAELTGHEDAVSEVDFGPGGRMASVSRDGTLALWGPRDRTPRARLANHATWLRAVDFAPDGRTVATAGDDGKVVLWDTAARAPALTLAVRREQFRTVAFSPDGRTLAAAGTGRRVVLWDVRRDDRGVTARQTPRRILTGHSGPVWAAVFAPDGRTLATSGADRTVRLWHAASGRPLAVLRGHSRSVDAVDFSPDGRTLASGGQDRTVRLWDLRRRTPIVTLHGHGDEVRAVAFAPDGRTLVSSGHDQTLVVWDPAHRSRLATFTGHDASVYSVSFRRSGTLLALGGESGRISLWDVGRAPLTGHTSRVNKVVYGPDGRSLVTASRDRTGGVWDPGTGRRRAVLAGGTGAFRSVAVSPDGRTVAAATGASRDAPVASGRPARRTDHPLLVWPAGRSGSPVRLFGHWRHLTDVVFSPDGRTLATSGADGRVVLWDPVRRTRLGWFAVDTGTAGTAVNALAFSPDGRLLATAGADGRVALWDPRLRVRIATFGGHTAPVTSVAFAPDGTTLASAGLDQTIRLWDVRRRAGDGTLASAPANAVAFGPDGRTLAVATTDSEVVLWDLADRTRRATLTGHTRQVRTLAFSPDGRTLASAGDDQTVRLWDTDPDRTRRRLCRSLGRDLTEAEWRQYLPGLTRHRTCG
ncbi:nSTAND1 domain-containing NTPase [Streptomyces sp. JNUCC 64]